MEGQVAVFDSRSPISPCYQCLYSQGGDEDASCSENGVMAPLVGIIGAVLGDGGDKAASRYW